MIPNSFYEESLLQKVAVVSINHPGFDASKKLSLLLREQYEITLFAKQTGDRPYEKLDEILDEVWQYDIILFFLATGIVIRKIANRLKSKAEDPAVLVMDFDLTQVVPLLSGHIGGANAFAEHLCQLLPNCQAFITTATDQTNNFAFDLYAKEKGYGIENLHHLAPLSNALINDEPIQIVAYPSTAQELESRIQKPNDRYVSIKEMFKVDGSIPMVIISPVHARPDALILRIRPLALGLGMNRDTSLEEIETVVHGFLLEHRLEISDVEKIASFEAKRDEKGLCEFCEKYGFTPQFFDESSINALTQELSPSKAQGFFGIKGVAEPAAILASQNKELFLKKHIDGNMTIAAAF